MYFEKYLTEEYYKRYSRSNEIFVNPTTRELLKYFGKNNQIRWSSNYKKKLLYVWNADDLHYDIYESFPEILMHCLVRGIATIKSNGKLITEDLDDITPKPGIEKPIYKDVFDYLMPYFSDDIVKNIFDSYDQCVKSFGESWLKQWWK